jgi:hypothetical protein
MKHKEDRETGYDNIPAPLTNNDKISTYGSSGPPAQVRT